MLPRKLKMYVKEPPEKESKQSMDTMDFSLHKRDDSILTETINIIPAEDDVFFPHLIRPLTLFGAGMVKAVNESVSKNELIGIVSLKYNVEQPKHTDFYDIGTAMKVIQVVESTSDYIKVLIEGVVRIRITEYIQTEPYYKARVEELREFTEKSETIDVLVQSVKTLFKLSAMLGKILPKKIIPMIDNINNPSILADLVAIYLELSIDEKQKLLEMVDPQKRLRIVFHHLNKDVQLREVQGKIDEDVAKELSKAQREYFLREQLKAIQKELGKEDPHIEEINPASAEYPVSRTYLEYLINIPWNKKTTDRLDIHQAEKILDEDHYGLEKVKERILEFLSVHKLKEKIKGP